MGILSPTKSVSKSFEEVKDTAFEGSDYGDEEGGLLETIIGFVVLIGIVVVVVWLIRSVVKRKKAIKAFYEQANYYREVPNGRRDPGFHISWHRPLMWQKRRVCSSEH